MDRSIFYVIAVFVLAAVGVNFLLPEPNIPDLKKRAANFEKGNQLYKAKACYLILLHEDSNNIENHYNYISSHYNLPKSEQKSRNQYVERDDHGFRDYYYNKATSPDSLQHDIGYYGWGLCWNNEGDYSFALSCFDSVRNKHLKFLNNSIGYAFAMLHEPAVAEKYFRREIADSGNISAAYSNLINLYLNKQNIAALNGLLANPVAAACFSGSDLRRTYFLQGQYWKYFTTVITRPIDSTNAWGFFGAIMILFSWLFFLRKIDIFEPERWRYIILTCILGMGFSLGTYLLSDIVHEYLHFDLNGGFWNDLVYAVFGIGSVEELMKFLPLLVMLVFTKQVNEPIDYIIFASVSALGFAFMENLLYFQESQLYIMHGRAITAVISHMFDTSVIGYGLMLARYKMGWNKYLAFLVSFLIASFTHGFYDFWLINDGVSDFKIITIVFMIVTLIIYNRFIENALCNSTFFSKKKMIDAGKLKDSLFYSLSAVFLCEYLIMSLKYGPTAGNIAILKAATTGAYLIFFLSANLSNYRIERGRWRSVFDFVKTKD